MRNVVVSALAVSLVGCASQQHVETTPYLQRVDADALPAPSRADLTADPRLYLLGPRDYVAVTVVGLPDLSLERIQIDNSGNLFVPLAGAMRASGKTPGELSREIERRLKAEYVRNPRVAVNVLETESQFVTVDGEVRTPGQYPVLGKMTLTTAVASAQGATQFANQRYVVVFREIERRRYAALYDLRAIRTGVAADPEVFPNDLVVVGESRARRLFSDVLAASPLLLAPIITLIN